MLAGVWTPHENFAGPDGLVPSEIVWAALDCRGWYAWLVREAHSAGLVGTMTGEVVRLRYCGVAMFTADGECLARGRQVWIAFPTPA